MAVTCLRAPALSTKRPQQPPPHTPARALPIFPQGVKQSFYLTQDHISIIYISGCSFTYIWQA